VRALTEGDETAGVNGTPHEGSKGVVMLSRSVTLITTLLVAAALVPAANVPIGAATAAAETAATALQTHC
jgi:hypothetical protein